MTLSSVGAIVGALNRAGVRYIVVGGLAVNAHGYLRFTKDIDIVVALDRDNVLAAFAALAPLGYSPLVPVTAEQFADPALRDRMIEEKGMKVLQLFSDAHRETPVDLFVSEPFDFAAEHRDALVRDLAGVGEVRFASVATLIRLKEAAGRPEDLVDVHYLRSLQDD